MADAAFFDLGDGTSVWQYYYPQPGYNQIDVFYNNSTGANFADLWDLSSGDSYFAFFNTSPGVDQIAYHYSGQEAQGALLDTDVNYTNNGSTIIYGNIGPNIQSYATHYTGANETGVATNTVANFQSGGSVNIIYAANGQLPAGIQQQSNFYNYADTQGPITFTQTNFNDGTSEQEQYNPSSNVLNAKTFYSGPSESGTVTANVINYTDAGVNSQNFPDRSYSSITVYNLGTSTGAFGGANISSETIFFGGQDGHNGITFIAANFATPGPNGSLSAISYVAPYTDTSFNGFLAGFPGGTRGVTDYHAGSDVSGSIVLSNYAYPQSPDTQDGRATSSLTGVPVVGGLVASSGINQAVAQIDRLTGSGYSSYFTF